MARQMAGGLVLLACWLLASCGPQQQADAGDVSSLTTFDLTPEQMQELSEQALAGDAEASFRMAELYIYAGGEGDPMVDDAHDKAEKRRWLELAARQGHEAAKHRLAIDLTKDDCPRARRLMTEIARHSPDAESRRNAEGWLSDPPFACQP